jgi:hypothetical protein
VAAGLTTGAAGKSASADGWWGGLGRWNASQSHLAGQIDDRPVARTSARRWFRLTKRGFMLPIHQELPARYTCHCIAVKAGIPDLASLDTRYACVVTPYLARALSAACHMGMALKAVTIS